MDHGHYPIGMRPPPAVLRARYALRQGGYFAQAPIYSARVVVWLFVLATLLIGGISLVTLLFGLAALVGRP